MEIPILDHAFFERASDWSSDANDGIVFTIRQRRDDHNYRLAIGSGNPEAGVYLKRLTTASERRTTGDIFLQLKTDAEATSNKVDVHIDGFFTDDINKHLWTLGVGVGVIIKLRVALGMTQFSMAGHKMQILERGFINNDDMSLSHPQLTGVDFPTSILETGYSARRAREHRHLCLSGTLRIALVCDHHLPCHTLVNSKKLVLEKVLTDIDLVCGGKMVKCHKAFLAGQSPVFAEMFKNEIPEGGKRTIVIDDCTPEAVSDVVAYIYDGSVGDRIQRQPKLAVDLLKASHKYKITPLEQRVADVILTKENDWCDLETALQLFLFVKDLKNFAEMKIKAVEFIRAKHDEMFQSEGLISLFKEDHKVALELFALGVSIKSTVKVRDGSKL